MPVLRQVARSCAQERTARDNDTRAMRALLGAGWQAVERQVENYGERRRRTYGNVCSLYGT